MFVIHDNGPVRNIVVDPFLQNNKLNRKVYMVYATKLATKRNFSIKKKHARSNYLGL